MNIFCINTVDSNFKLNSTQNKTSIHVRYSKEYRRKRCMILNLHGDDSVIYHRVTALIREHNYKRPLLNYKTQTILNVRVDYHFENILKQCVLNLQKKGKSFWRK